MNNNRRTTQLLLDSELVVKFIVLDIMVMVLVLEELITQLVYHLKLIGNGVL